MIDVNTFTVAGIFLSCDLNDTGNTAYADVYVATNDTKDRYGNQEAPKANWNKHKLRALGDTAYHLSELRRGDAIVVQGQMVSWEGKNKSGGRFTSYQNRITRYWTPGDRQRSQARQQSAPPAQRQERRQDDQREQRQSYRNDDRGYQDRGQGRGNNVVDLPPQDDVDDIPF